MLVLWRRNNGYGSSDNQSLSLIHIVTYAHGSKDTLKRDVASDLMAADDMMKRGITGIDVVKALAESGYTVLADNILNLSLIHI